MGLGCYLRWRRRLCFRCGLFVCLFVCLSVGLLANLWTDFDEIFWSGRAWLKDQVIQFWWRSGSRFGSGSPKSEIRILRIGGGLCCLSISSYFWFRYFGVDLLLCLKCSCAIIYLCPAPQLDGKINELDRCLSVGTCKLHNTQHEPNAARDSRVARSSTQARCSAVTPKKYGKKLRHDVSTESRFS